MLDLHFCTLSVLKHFDKFQVLEDFGSDHSATLTSLSLKLQNEFDLKTKVNFKKFKHMQQSITEIPACTHQSIQTKRI